MLISYVGEDGGSFGDLVDNCPDIDESYLIKAGKFRRYHKESWFRRLTDIQTIFKNARDLVLVILGIVQAYRLLGKIKPDVVFLKGGFVGLPVGLAAAARHIPIITHDSDVTPGLANRLVGKWASVHAVAQDPDLYPYPPEKTKQVGVLVGSDYREINEHIQKEYKQSIAVPPSCKMLLITGGSSGSAAINQAVSAIALDLLETDSRLYMVHQVGKGKQGVYDGIAHDRLQVLEFLNPMYEYTGAADIVICRSSANTLAELGTQKKPVITIPGPQLSDGHQLKNADYLLANDAAVVVNEPFDSDESLEFLKKTILDLLDDKTRKRQLASNLKGITIANAANNLAVLIKKYGDKG